MLHLTRILLCLTLFVINLHRGLCDDVPCVGTPVIVSACNTTFVKKCTCDGTASYPWCYTSEDMTAWRLCTTQDIDQGFDVPLNCSPVDCTWTSWSEWSECLTLETSDQHFRFRTRDEIKEFNGGKPCCDGDVEQDTNYCLYRPTDCADIYRSTTNSNSGVYTIYPTTLSSGVQVYCDMYTNGGGWTVFQRREDGSVNFYRNWTEYENTFGDLNGEFWLGNIFISAITNQALYKLRVELHSSGDARSAEYDSFSVDDEATNFKLHVSGYSGDAGDSLTFHDGMMFSTFDMDNDLWGDSMSCASTFKGAWWYNDCHTSNLNGLYLNGPHSTYADGIEWRTFTGYEYSLLKTEMKIRPVDF